MKFVGFLVMLFVGMTLLNRFIGGEYITASDVGVMNTLAISHEQSILGFFTVPILNLDFFYEGIPRLVKWDYAFFGGNAEIFRYFLYSFTFALSFMLFVMIIGLATSFISRFT